MKSIAEYIKEQNLDPSDRKNINERISNGMKKSWIKRKNENKNKN